MHLPTHSRPGRAAASLLAVLLLLAGTARAAPFTAYFAPLRAKVVLLRDAIGDPQTKADAKTKAALDKILAEIDDASASLAEDVVTAKTVVGPLVKRFDADPELSDAAKGLLTALGADVRTCRQSLAARLDALPASKLVAKARKLDAKVAALLAAADTAAQADDLKKFASVLNRASSGCVALATATANAEAGGGGACGGNLNSGLRLELRGAGYGEDLSQGGAAELIQGTPQTYAVYDQGPLTLEFELAPDRGDVHVGPATALSISVEDFTGGFRGRWEASDVQVDVAEERADRVRLCFDVVLTSAGPQQPATITMKGYLVFER